MLKELLEHDQLGTKNEITFVLCNGLKTSETPKVGHFRAYCTSHVFSIGRSFNGILELLKFMSFIDISDDTIKVNKSFFDPNKQNSDKDYFLTSNFFEYLFSAMKREGFLSDFFNADALKYNLENDMFFLKENLIPYKYMSFRNLMLSLDFFKRDTLIRNHLIISSNFHPLVNNMIVPLLQLEQDSSAKRKISLEDLKKQLKAKDEHGMKAELYALSYEQKRLAGHSKFKSIKRISDDFVNAGYDIESFSDRESILLDRFIEVKSFTGRISFFWSKSEVSTAKKLKEKYFLFLVDRDKMSFPDYKPSILQDPYQKIFENEFWKVEVENWKISLEKD